MRRGVVLIILVAGTFYLALIYRSRGLVFLGYAEIFLSVLLLLYTLRGIFQLYVSFEAPSSITERGKRIPIEISIRNYSSLPTGKVAVQLVESYAHSKKGKKTVFYTSVAGKESNKEYGITVIHAVWKPVHTGKVVMKIRKAACFDLLGFFSLPLPKKAFYGSESFMVLPAIYEVPIITGDAVREAASGQEHYMQNKTEDPVTEQFQIRGYQPGDRIRSVHWKLSAKEDELMVKDYQPIGGCPVLFFLKLGHAAGRRERKKEARRQEYFFSVAVSLSKGMVQSECVHYVIWFDGAEQDVMRCRVESEEDIYILLGRISNIETSPKGFELEEGYREKYRERSYAAKLVLNGNLQLCCNDEQVVNYNVHNLAKSLAEQVIFL